jgi:hypothetical protein
LAEAGDYIQIKIVLGQNGAAQLRVMTMSDRITLSIAFSPPRLE